MDKSKSLNSKKASKIGKKKLEEPSSDKKGVRAKKRKYIHGNYPSYYNHRKTSGSVTNDNKDPRLKLVKEKHLEGQRILDIGCNTGEVTLEVATTYKAKEVVGIDIDRGLIARAKARVEKTSNLQFEVLDMLKWSNEERKKFDVALCLSLTKWIHLNNGDDGLLRLFNKLNGCLKIGGLLIFEPQPWPSYKKAKRRSDIMTLNYRMLKIKPESFVRVLMGRFGFKLKKHLAHRDKMKVRSSQNVGFSRPLYLLKKLTDSTVQDSKFIDIIEKFGVESLNERERKNPPNPEALERALNLEKALRLIKTKTIGET